MQTSRIILIVAILFGGLNSFSQITISASDFPSSDDTAMISISDDFGVDYTTTGASSVWDFTGINITAQRIDTFFNPSDASLLVQVIFNNFLSPDYESDYFNTFLDFDLPGAGAAGISIGNNREWTKFESGAVEKTGLTLDLNGVEVPSPYDEKDTAYTLPVDFGNSWTAYTFMDLDLNPAFDGILRRHQYRTATVDGWGTVTTDYGTFDALRVRMDFTYEDSLYIGTFGTWLTLPSPDRHEYLWWTNGQKVPVMKIVTTGPSGTEVISRVEYKDIDKGYLGTKSKQQKVGIYPNPTNDLLTIESTESLVSTLLMDLSGKLIHTETLSGHSAQLDLSSYQAGIYLLKVRTEVGESTKQLVIQ